MQIYLFILTIKKPAVWSVFGPLWWAIVTKGSALNIHVVDL